MIQRVQSIFYLLAAVSLGGLFKFPFATSLDPVPEYLGDQIYNIMDHFIMTGLVGLGIITSLMALFMYKNRGLQLKLGYLVIIISILLPLVAFLLIYIENTALKEGAVIDDGLGLYLPVLALLFGALANRYVKKDEKTVRSMDRLR